jgi:hypothetical protein
MPSFKARSLAAATYTFCVEHDTLTPVFLLVRNVDQEITRLLTELFLDDVSVVKESWNIDEKHLLVASVDTKWLPDAPENFECMFSLFRFLKILTQV